ncbi:MAG: hypothetical protein COU11_03020 [Candidatus Harrisonbacteria bacterium CG10_big_fil_rev_8_21_14_0_10_49_15]|uniref:Endonuclease/exonuclease/phosphatase domain-containing protein n=1 Tax=Candidatus Harrisonbacteria bacterium CG10_big_fil_rev_8_21_14_0_10_49_15 TaxID=1974587 RepID=A0A2H0UKN6_9BACT|nr:MAG: hypothetical protein COU11_03020 [Candidatus Harrisonbacteria bacterium CG10_big_fil_rev_8_21_14_0_10_49_15]
MRIISLNLWAGTLFKPLLEYIKQEAEQTDIFCFQEMVFHGPAEQVTKHSIRGNLYAEIAAILPDHNGYKRLAPEGSQFGPFGDHVVPEEGVRLGISIFAKKDLPLKNTGEFFTYPEDKNPFAGGKPGLMTGNFQYIQLPHSAGLLTVGSLHGLWQQHKKDTPERLEQSRLLLDFFRQQTGAKILLGDFNLEPHTESIAMISRELRNLITENEIFTTRNAQYKDMERYKDYIADYAFVSKDVKVKKFDLPPIEVSDHLPLVLEIE